jgi:hypothetical protein
MLDAMQVDLRVDKAAEPRLIARIATPLGEVELR